jgi:tRNA threonylcarbamoyl adenosine modification protein YeaZ
VAEGPALAWSLVLVLAVDTATPLVSVAVVDGDGRLVAQREELATNRHGELLAPLIDAALADAGAVPADLTAVAAGLGPGPFTGLRVGIVTAAVMGDALAIPTYGECSLDAVLDGSAGACLVVTDARRRQVYWAGYDDDGRRVEGPELGPPADVARTFQGRVQRVLGAGAVLHRDDFAGFDIDETHQHPRARSHGAVAVARLLRGEVGDVLTPMYLRRPDAQPPGAPKKVTPA